MNEQNNKQLFQTITGKHLEISLDQQDDSLTIIVLNLDYPSEKATWLKHLFVFFLLEVVFLFLLRFRYPSFDIILALIAVFIVYRLLSLVQLG